VSVEGALDAARTASAATLLRGGVERLPALLALVASAGRVLRQNMVFSIAYNALAVPAALVGWVHPAVAAVAMAASSITIVLNSLRISDRA
jgi:cation transport ATPase